MVTFILAPSGPLGKAGSPFPRCVGEHFRQCFYFTRPLLAVEGLGSLLVTVGPRQRSEAAVGGKASTGMGASPQAPISFLLSQAGTMQVAPAPHT